MKNMLLGISMGSAIVVLLFLLLVDTSVIMPVYGQVTPKSQGLQNNEELLKLIAKETIEAIDKAPNDIKGVMVTMHLSSEDGTRIFKNSQSLLKKVEITANDTTLSPVRKAGVIFQLFKDLMADADRMDIVGNELTKAGAELKQKLELNRTLTERQKMLLRLAALAMVSQYGDQLGELTKGMKKIKPALDKLDLDLKKLSVPAYNL